MNMKKNMKYLGIIFASLFLMTSCIEDDTVRLTDEGNTIIKVNGGTENALYFSPFLDVRKVDMLDLRRDANSADALNQSATVTLSLDPSLVDQYNADNEADFAVLPDEIYSFVTDNGVSISGNTLTVTFNPGEFAKVVSINLDGSQWDLAYKYALGFKMESSSQGVISNGTPTSLTTISVKNKYDGKYLLTGQHTRVPYNFPYETEVELRTFAANSVIFYWPLAGSVGHPIGVGPGELSWYGPAVSPIVVMDLDTDKVADVYNNSNAVPIFKWDEDGVTNGNYYDNGSKTLYVSWNYLGRADRGFIDKCEYIGSR